MALICLTLWKPEISAGSNEPLGKEFSFLASKKAFVFQGNPGLDNSTIQEISSFPGSVQTLN